MQPVHAVSLPEEADEPKPATDTEWQSPQGAAEQEMQTSHEVSRHHHVHTVPSNPLFPEPDDTFVPDWRDGATEDELRQFGAIADSASVAAIHKTWSIDDEQTEKPPLKKKTTKKRAPVSKKSTLKKPSKKTTGGTAHGKN